MEPPKTRPRMPPAAAVLVSVRTVASSDEISAKADSGSSALKTQSKATKAKAILPPWLSYICRVEQRKRFCDLRAGAQRGPIGEHEILDHEILPKREPQLPQLIERGLRGWKCQRVIE